MVPCDRLKGFTSLCFKLNEPVEERGRIRAIVEVVSESNHRGLWPACALILEERLEVGEVPVNICDRDPLDSARSRLAQRVPLSARRLTLSTLILLSPLVRHEHSRLPGLIRLRS